MRDKAILFFKAFLINGLLYGVLKYLIESDVSLKGIVFSASFFGFFMAIFQTLLFPGFNKDKKDKQ